MSRYVLIVLLITNLATFLAFGLDKRRAKKDRWRISEKTLIIMGRCFGGIGQLAGMKVFHHKTKKWYFAVSGVLFTIIQTGILIWYFTNWKIL